MEKIMNKNNNSQPTPIENWQTDDSNPRKKYFSFCYLLKHERSVK